MRQSLFALFLKGGAKIRLFFFSSKKSGFLFFKKKCVFLKKFFFLLGLRSRGVHGPLVDGHSAPDSRCGADPEAALRHKQVHPVPAELFWRLILCRLILCRLILCRLIG
jgi:hypothetical protein